MEREDAGVLLYGAVCGSRAAEVSEVKKITFWLWLLNGILAMSDSTVSKQQYAIIWICLMSMLWERMRGGNDGGESKLV